MAAIRMATNSKQESILVRRENDQGLRFSLDIQIGNHICFDLSNIRYLLESRNIHSQSAQKNLRRKLQPFCTTGSLAL
jgi:hypothetical protein